MDKPFLSIVIPAYNREKELPRLMESLASQGSAFARTEIVLVDDGSSDGTYAALRRYAGEFPNVIALSMGVNSGVHAARNKGMDAASGEWLAFVDADDYLVPGGLEIACRGLAERAVGYDVAFFPLRTSDTQESTGFVADGEYHIDQIFAGKVFRPEKGCVGCARSRLLRERGIRWYHTNMDFLFWREVEIRAAGQKALFMDSVVGVYDRTVSSSLGKKRKDFRHRLRHAGPKVESVLRFLEKTGDYFESRPGTATELLASAAKDFLLAPGKRGFFRRIRGCAGKHRAPASLRRRFLLYFLLPRGLVIVRLRWLGA